MVRVGLEGKLEFNESVESENIAKPQGIRHWARHLSLEGEG